VGLEPDEPQNQYIHAAVLLNLDRTGRPKRTSARPSACTPTTPTTSNCWPACTWAVKSGPKPSSSPTRGWPSTRRT
jgi:hypothetical protein